MPKTLFLADDSVTIQRVVELTFAHEDIRVVAVGDGRQAVQWLEAERPDIILLDVELPEVSGFEIASRVRKSPKLRPVPILLLAGAFEVVDEDRGRAVGADGIIKKPFEPEQLVARVKELLATGNAQIRPETAKDRLKSTPAPVAQTAPEEKPEAPVNVTVQAAPEVVEKPNMRREPLAAAAGGGGGGGYTPDPPIRSVPGFPGLTQAAPEPLEPPARPIWESGPPQRGAEPARPAASAPKVSLSNAFSALLAAEQTNPSAAPAAPATTVIISESAIEDAVRRVLAKMTDDLVHRIVLDTAERLIREELEKIRQEPE